MSRLDPDRVLALAYVPARHRAALSGLWDLDTALASVLATGTEPMISRIRLAWWRESLERLDQAPPPAEPVLERVAATLLPLGLSGTALSGMEEGWAVLLEPDPLTTADLETYAQRRGGLLFGFGARMLGGDETLAAEGGCVWALMDLARHSANVRDAEAARAAAAGYPRRRWPPALRPLGMLALLASGDARRAVPEPQGAPRRMARMLRHRLSGR